MLSYRKCRLYRPSRLVMALVIASGALALSGCPGSNWSNPQLATPQAPQAPEAIVTPPVTAPPVTAPPVTAPPVTPPPPITPPPITPPPVEKPPAPPASVAAPVAPPPIATDGTLFTTMGGTKGGALVGTGTGALIYAIIVPTLSGITKLIDPSTGAFTYAPNPNFSGSDRLQFTVTDSVGTSKPATVTITVDPSAIGALSAPANIGINVEGVSYYDSSQQYVDMMRMASEWETTDADTVNGPRAGLQKIDALDENGWPKQDAATNFGCCVMPNGRPASPGNVSPLVGKYQLSFNGKASVYFLAGTVVDQQYTPATNTTTATLVREASSDGNGSAHMIVTFSKTQRTDSAPINTGITNVRMIRPQFTPNGVKWWDRPDQEFTNPFLASLAPFSTLRFMDWTLTNANQQSDWNQRTPGDWPTSERHIKTDGYWGWNGTSQTMEPLTDSWTNSGQSWESVINLANVTGKDIWINIPERATDDYVKSLATLLKQKLKAGTHIYVEYSNELWNYSFEQQYYIAADVKALLANDPTAAANYQKYSAPWANTASRAAERLMQISNDFASVWGAQAINDRVRPVFCWQTGSSALQEAMGYVKETYGPPNKYFYGVCSAPYWTPDRTQITEGKSVDDLLTDSAGSIPGVVGTLGIYTTTALYYGLHNLTYEGGPGMDGNVDVANMIAANVDPRMGQQVTQALTSSFESGLDMFVYYSSVTGAGKYGMWGATDDVFDLTRPKWAALQALIGKSVTRTLTAVGGVQLPGTIDAAKPRFGVMGGTPRMGTFYSYCHATTTDLPGMCSFRGDKPAGNTQYGYLVVVPKAGSYTVTLKFDNRDSGNPASTAQFYVNQAPQGGVINIAPSSGTGSGTAPALNVTLRAGISLIELEATSGYFALQTITITAN